MNALSDVVVLVALAVVAHRGLVDRRLGGRQVDVGASPCWSRPRPRPRGRSATGGRRRRPAGPGGRGPRRSIVTAPPSPRSSTSACAITPRTSSSVSGSRRSSRTRESSGEITEKNGFSVVAATRVTQRFSTPGQQRVLLGLVEAVHLVDEQHRLGRPRAPARRGRPSMAARTSLTPADDRGDLDEAPVGLPATGSRRSWSCRCPGGPHSSSDIAWSPSISWRSGEPGRAQLLLADQLVEGARAHPDGERRRGVGVGVQRPPGASSGGSCRGRCLEEPVVTHRRRGQDVTPDRPPCRSNQESV